MNAKHQFKYTYNETDYEEFSPLEVTFEMPAEVSLTQMLNNFEQYLRACGFFFDGKLAIVEDSYDLPEEEEEPEYGCMGDWDEEDDSPTFHDTLSTAICEDAKKKKFCCGLEDTSSPLEDEWDKICRETEEESEQKLKEWNEGIAKLENNLKEQRKIKEKANLSADLLKNTICSKDYPNSDSYTVTNKEYDEISNKILQEQIKKNKWVHGMCNPPSPDWKKQNEETY